MHPKLKLFVICLIPLSAIFAHPAMAQNRDLYDLEINWRSTFMGTDQYEDLRNPSTLATGGSIAGAVHPAENFTIAAGIYGTQRLLGSDLSVADATTGRYSRFVLGNYDVTDPNNKNVFLLGEAYINWAPKNHNIRVGRFKLATPFLNPQDGRMIPTLSQGIGYQYEKDIWKLQAYYINALAPRSTPKWRLLKNTIGLYSQGRNTDGTDGNHLGKTSTKGLGILGIQRKEDDLPSFQFYHYFLQNIFHLSYLKVDQQYDLSSPGLTLGWQLQGVAQFGTGEGGNEDPDLRYINPDHESYGFGGNVWLQLFKNRFSIQTFRITDNGRMLFPRGWGHGPYSTFQKPERLEGQGDTFSLMGKVQRTFRADNVAIKGGVSYGITNLTDPSDPKLNKYALPSHRQLNANVNINPTAGALKDFDLNLFWTYKYPKSDNLSNLKFIYNKVNLHLFQFTINYNFSL